MRVKYGFFSIIKNSAALLADICWVFAGFRTGKSGHFPDPRQISAHTDTLTKIPVSAAIITLDAAAELEPCLASLGFADDIVIVDSGSTDDTLAIARRHGARVISAPWRGFGAQKQLAVDAARHDWVLCVDADERVTPELAQSIAGAIARPGASACRMARCNRFLGRWLRHGEGYPDWSLRLFDRRTSRWSDDAVHERVIHAGAVVTLAGDLQHESAATLAQYLAKQNRYTSLQASHLHGQGCRAGVLRLIASPLLRFIKFYVLRLGFLDGAPGLIHISIGCINSYLKYAKLIELERAHGTGSPQ
jgi:glycosyltransferase involved in cell wall biosynthesis